MDMLKELDRQVSRYYEQEDKARSKQEKRRDVPDEGRTGLGKENIALQIKELVKRYQQGTRQISQGAIAGSVDNFFTTVAMIKRNRDMTGRDFKLIVSPLLDENLKLVAAADFSSPEQADTDLSAQQKNVKNMLTFVKLRKKVLKDYDIETQSILDLVKRAPISNELGSIL